MKGKMKEDIKETNQGKLRGNIKENQGEKSRKIKGKYQGEKSRKIKEENQGKSRENKYHTTYHSVKAVPAGLEKGPEEIGEHVDRELGGKHDGVKHFEPVQNILRPLQFIRAVVIRQ